MALYYITNASKDSNDTITVLRAASGSPHGLGERFTKAEMIALLETGLHTAKTYNLGRSADVRVVGGRFLRSDANDIQADNLGDLPPV
jgi:hypothetical protein